MKKKKEESQKSIMTGTGIEFAGSTGELVLDEDSGKMIPIKKINIYSVTVIPNTNKKLIEDIIEIQETNPEIKTKIPEENKNEDS